MSFFRSSSLPYRWLCPCLTTAPAGTELLGLCNPLPVYCVIVMVTWSPLKNRKKIVETRPARAAMSISPPPSPGQWVKSTLGFRHILITGVPDSRWLWESGFPMMYSADLLDLHTETYNCSSYCVSATLHSSEWCTLWHYTLWLTYKVNNGVCHNAKIGTYEEWRV